MSNVKQLIRARNLKFLHPNIVKKANEDELAAILKSVAYFRNFKIFKTLYALLYKNKIMTLDHYRDIFNSLIEYEETHPKDYFIDGFSRALAKSENISKEVKHLYGIMLYNILYKDSSLFPRRLKIEKAVEEYYKNFKPINAAIIKKSKVLKITSDNIVKSIIRLCNL